MSKFNNTPVNFRATGIKARKDFEFPVTSALISRDCFEQSKEFVKIDLVTTTDYLKKKGVDISDFLKKLKEFRSPKDKRSPEAQELFEFISKFLDLNTKQEIDAKEFPAIKPVLDAAECLDIDNDELRLLFYLIAGGLSSDIKKSRQKIDLKAACIKLIVFRDVAKSKHDPEKDRIMFGAGNFDSQTYREIINEAIQDIEKGLPLRHSYSAFINKISINVIFEEGFPENLLLNMFPQA